MNDKLSARGQRSILVLNAPISGIPLGAGVATADGILPIEHLTPGDRIITREYGMQELAWFDYRYVTCNTVRLAPDALGQGRPDKRMILPAGQRLLIRDWRAKTLYGEKSVSIAAHRLTDGHYVRDVGARSLRLFYLGFARNCTVYAGGFEMSSHTKADLPQTLSPKSGGWSQVRGSKSQGA